LKKKQEKEKLGVTLWVDLARPSQDPVANLLIFFVKTMLF
jgi:hypothetical protein